VVLSNRMQPITNEQTPHLAIMGQKSLDRLKNTIPVKILHFFCLKMTKGKTEYY
jgi:glycine cleavage system pyridoxal-binding protein P